MWRVRAGLWLTVNTHPEERAEWPEMAHDFRLGKHLRRVWGLSRCVSREGKQRKVSNSWPSQGLVQRPGSSPPGVSPPSQGRTPSPLAKAQNCPNWCPKSPLLSHTFFLSQTHRHTPGTADLRNAPLSPWGHGIQAALE